MKNLKTLAALALASPLFLGACSSEDVQAAVDKAQNFDVSSLSIEDMTSTFSDISGQLTEKLGSITDLASAEKMKEQVGPLLDKAVALKDALGDKMPSMESLSGIAQQLKDKFSGDSAIMDVLKPIMEKLQSLVG